ncbi:OTU-domain-containing protein [Rhodotorula sp. JG-1b]|nr:OTU-domain-containing protein [Rhodotorula sp. JG-1b]
MASAPAQQHEQNVDTLVSAATKVVPPPPALNPLLARGKLRKTNSGGVGKKKNSKNSKPPAPTRTELIKDVYQAKQGELEVVSAGGADPAEEGDVLDLADQLLQQLGDQIEEDQQQRTEGAAPPSASSLNAAAAASSTGAAVDSRKTTSTGAMSPVPSTASSHASHGSGQTARERLHDFKDGLKDAFMPNRKSDSASSSGTNSLLGGSGGNGEKKMGRQEARKLRKAQAMEQQRQEAAAEVAAENDNSIEAERTAIGAQCRKLHLHIKEIEPDGHCMYSAIADQANFLKLSQPEKETYQTTRKHAADYMRTHPDDFLPFLPSEEDPENMMGPDEFRRYCDTVEKTAEWGGEPEIRALSLYYKAPIIVVQAGTDMVEHGSDFPRERAMLISYHRKMYGLGEHYNSLRPSTHGAPHVLPPAPAATDPIGQRVIAV